MIADEVAKWLEEKDISHAFGIIGGGNVVLWDAIARRGFTELVCCHHEQAAVMAAAYYYRICDRPALALVTTGAGSTNAITGVMAAYMDSIPVLVISGNEASKYMEKPTRTWGVQGYDSTQMVKGCVKAYARPSAGSALGTIEGCLEVALKPRQGPVWIDLPKDVQQCAQ